MSRGANPLGRALGALGLAPALLAGCGNGGGGTVPSICFSFVPDAAPSASTVVARSGSGSSCELLVVELVLTDVTDVFAVSFRASFDPSLLAYDGHSLAGSHLTSDGAQVQALETVGQGEVQLGLSRLNPAGGIDFGGPQVFVKLLFRKPVGAQGGSGRLDFADTQVFDSQQPPQPKPGIVWLGGTVRLE